jgi:Tol biopolymer transport system component
MRRSAAIWVAALVACGGNDSLTAPTGSLQVVITTTGQPSTETYSVSLDGAAATAIGVNATINLTAEAGTHTLELSGLPQGCTVSGDNPRSVSVTADATTPVSFAVTCVPPVGIVEVRVTTSGPGPSSYDVLLDGASQGAIQSSATLSLPNVAVGGHSIGLSALPANCQLQEPNPQSVTVSPGATVPVVFTISCTAPPAETGTLTIRTVTTGQDSDGYQVSVDGAAPQPIGSNASVTLTNTAAGAHSVQLSGIDSTCALQGPNPRPVTVTAATVATVRFAVTCAPPPPTTGGLRITTATSGSGSDPNGYTVAVDAGAPQAIATSGTITVSDLAVGAHTVALSDLGAGCTVTGDNPRSVSVTAGAVVDVSFAVTCTGPAPSRIAFNSNARSLQAIFVVNPDGSGLTKLSPTGAFDINPVWSPDASKLLFGSDHDLYVMNGDGSARTKLVEGQGIFTFRWSRDGTKIAFIKERPEGEDTFEDLWVMNADGSGQLLLASNAVDPSWSPDGLKIVYAAANQQLHIINVDGTGDTPITDATIRAAQPAWSPDGSQIVFVSVPDKDLMLVNPDGSSLARLTSGTSIDDSPTWSPDGSRLAFVSGPANQPLETEVVLISRTGGSVTNLTNHPGFDFDPDWSPDGSKIVFTRSNGGDSEIYTMNTDGSAQVDVSNRPSALDTSPDWGGQPAITVAGRFSAAHTEALRRLNLLTPQR